MFRVHTHADIHPQNAAFTTGTQVIKLRSMPALHKVDVHTIRLLHTPHVWQSNHARCEHTFDPYSAAFGKVAACSVHTLLRTRFGVKSPTSVEADALLGTSSRIVPS